jgi:hypothetical protein
MANQCRTVKPARLSNGASRAGSEVLVGYRAAGSGNTTREDPSSLCVTPATEAGLTDRFGHQDELVSEQVWAKRIESFCARDTFFRFVNPTR